MAAAVGNTTLIDPSKNAADELLLSADARAGASLSAPDGTKPLPLREISPTAAARPLSTSASAPAGYVVEDSSPVVAPVDMVVERARASVRDARPWREFFDARQISIPNFADITDRVEKNLRAFRGNYEITAACWFAVGVVLMFGEFLIAGLLLLLVERWVRSKLRADNTLDNSHKAVVLGLVLFIIWITGVGEALVGYLFCAVLSVSAHAILHNPPDDDDIDNLSSNAV